MLESNGKRGRPRKQHEANIVIIDKGRPCRKCGEPFAHRVTNTYPNGNQRKVCKLCGTAYILRQLA
jgi:formylmethanofuran dehydrogenase subunit E